MASTTHPPVQHSNEQTPSVRELREVATEQIRKVIDDRLIRILEAISDDDIKDARLKDKAIAASILIEKRALLRGEPTQIMGREEIRQLDELGAALLVEMKRRNMVIEGEYVTVGEERSMVPINAPADN